MIKITAEQNDKEVELIKAYDKMIWSGLSWGAVEIRLSAFDHIEPLVILCSTAENDPLTLKANVY